MPVEDADNRNLAFAAALFEELARCGIEHVCICPGSRSAPLALAAAREPGLRCWTHIDERAAAFFALGLARVTRRPVALVATSGTAAVNFHPAVVEAHHARVPLLLLTANRPPELRDWGAGQTIDQARLYGSAVRWFAEAPLPETGEAALRHARVLACRAATEAAGSPAGPVHLDLPFREPLSPVPVPGDVPPGSGRGREGRPPAAYTEALGAPAAPGPELTARLLERLRPGARGVVVCGPLDAPPELAAAIAALATALGWPLLAEPTSQLRRGAHVGSAPLLSCADLFLRHPETAARLAPDSVLRFGDTPTSRPVRGWLARRPPRELVVVDPDGVWHDPDHAASAQLRLDPAALCAALLPHLAGTGSTSTEWAEELLEVDSRARRALDRALAGDDGLDSPRVVRELAAALPPGAQLTVANSLAVRDLDAFLAPAPEPLRVLANRGANGIDGLVSSALGAAAGSEAPSVLLTGDLAFLHDVGGLVAARRHELRATVVVLDDDGGGIFSFLPVADHADPADFRALFRVPHGLDLAAVARGFGLDATRASSVEHLRTALKQAIEAPGVSVVCVPIDAEHNLARHRELEAVVARALEPGAP